MLGTILLTLLASTMIGIWLSYVQQGRSWGF
jgi:hypothetical protein